MNSACQADPACVKAYDEFANERNQEGIDIARTVLGGVLFVVDFAGTVAEAARGMGVDWSAEEEQGQQIEDNIQSLQGACSFVPQTLVSTSTGKKPIVTLKKGEMVLSYNPKTKKMEWQPISHGWISRDDDLIDLTITTLVHTPHSKITRFINEVIHTNKKHPFLTLEKGFLSVDQIKLGMHVIEADNQKGIISGWKIVQGVKTMYSLEVAQDHTFTVGDGQWIVHNTGSECDDAAGPQGRVGLLDRLPK